jgi:hypothetical protein
MKTYGERTSYVAYVAWGGWERHGRWGSIIRIQLDTQVYPFVQFKRGIRRLGSHSDGLSPSGANFQTERCPAIHTVAQDPIQTPTMSGEAIVLEVAGHSIHFSEIFTTSPVPRPERYRGKAPEGIVLFASGADIQQPCP